MKVLKDAKEKASSRRETTIGWQGWLGWFLLVVGLILYIFPVFYDYIGSSSGLLAFVIIFVGISLLKMRKDQQR